MCSIGIAGSGCCKARTRSLAVGSETMNAVVVGRVVQIAASLGSLPALVTTEDVAKMEGVAL